MVALTFQKFNTYKSMIHSVFTGERKSLPLKAILYHQLCTIVCYCIIETSRFYFYYYILVRIQNQKNVTLKSRIYLFQTENFSLLCESKGGKKSYTSAYTYVLYKVARKLNGRYARNYNDSNVYLMS